MIRKTSGGVSEARKTGISRASGEYIICADSNDWIDDHMYEKVMPSLEDEDLVVSGLLLGLLLGMHIKIGSDSRSAVLK